MTRFPIAYTNGATAIGVPRMSKFGLLHRINRKRKNRVDAQLIHFQLSAWFD
jgi:hypothetical protein